MDFVIALFAQPGGEPERTALARLAERFDITAHQLGQPFRDGQAQSGAAILAGSRCVRLLESLEQPPDLLLGQADAFAVSLTEK